MLYGVTNGGKSYMANTFDTRDNTYYKPSDQWWDGYTGQRTVILDNSDPSELNAEMLRTMDPQDNNIVRYKGGVTLLQHETMILTTSFSPDKLWPGRVKKNALMERVHIIMKFDHEYTESSGLRYTIEKIELPTSFRLTAEHQRFINAFRST